MSNVRPQQNTMSSFEGLLESVSQSGDIVIARFIAGGFDPYPQEAPVYVLSLRKVHNIQAVLASLASIQAGTDGAYVCVNSTSEAYIQTDHGDELTIEADEVTSDFQSFSPNDYERLAKQNYDWGQSQYKALTESIERVNRLRALLHDQQARLQAKASGHEPGSTARTLYEQHLTFVARLLSESSA